MPMPRSSASRGLAQVEPLAAPRDLARVRDGGCRRGSSAASICRRRSRRRARAPRLGDREGHAAQRLDGAERLANVAELEAGVIEGRSFYYAIPRAAVSKHLRRKSAVGMARLAPIVQKPCRSVARPFARAACADVRSTYGELLAAVIVAEPRAAMRRPHAVGGSTSTGQQHPAVGDVGRTRAVRQDG